MSARNGSGTSRLKRSQYIATQASAAAQTSWTKASKARQLKRVRITVSGVFLRQ